MYVHEDLVHCAATHALVFDLIQFECKRICDMLFLPIAHAVPKHRRLAKMIAEARTTLANLFAFDFFSVRAERIAGSGRMHRTSATKTIRKIRYPPAIDRRPRHR